MTDHIIKAAKAAGGTTYTNRHHDGTACAFGPEALERFYLLAYRQGMERAAEICDGLVAATSNYPEAYEGLTAETKFARGVGECLVVFPNAIRAEAHAQNQPKNVHDTGNV